MFHSFSIQIEGRNIAQNNCLQVTKLPWRLLINKNYDKRVIRFHPYFCDSHTFLFHMVKPRLKCLQHISFNVSKKPKLLTTCIFVWLNFQLDICPFLLHFLKHLFNSVLFSSTITHFCHLFSKVSNSLLQALLKC